MIRILIADEHQISREGLARLLCDHHDFKVVGEAGNDEELMAGLRAHSPDLVILDLIMPGVDGIERIEAVHRFEPVPKCLVLTLHCGVHHAVRALRAGATGYLTKECTSADLVGAIRQIFRGMRYICPSIAEQLALGTQGEIPVERAHERLSNREYKIFEMLVAGKRGAEIASELALSEKTVSTHKAHVLRKLHLQSGLELMRYAIRNHLVAE
jgi:DNA-binding NarL/FixJ family response regulator